MLPRISLSKQGAPVPPRLLLIIWGDALLCEKEHKSPMLARGSSTSYRRWSGMRSPLGHAWLFWPPVADSLSGRAFSCSKLCILVSCHCASATLSHTLFHEWLCVCQQTAGCHIDISRKAHTWCYLLWLCNQTIYRRADSISKENCLSWPNRSSLISLITATAYFPQCKRLPHSRLIARCFSTFAALLSIRARGRQEQK